MLYQFYYSVPDGRLLHAIEVKRKTGIPIDTDPLEDPAQYNPTEHIAALNRAQIYPLTKTADPYNPSFYTTVVSYAVSTYPDGATMCNGEMGLPGDYATHFYTPTERPLATAKSNGKQDVRIKASLNSGSINENSGYSVDALNAAAAQLEANRGADIQATISLTGSIMAQADIDIQAVEAATSVSDIADIVEAPDLVINTGRGLASDDDMNPTYFPTINLGGVVESDLEIYIPNTDTILPYRTNIPSPYHFDMGSALFGSDYITEVRISASGVVVGRFECPDTGSGANVDIDLFTSEVNTPLVDDDDYIEDPGSY